jgi:hypothetical protein
MGMDGVATGRLSLLAHVTYYDSNKTQATAGASKSLKGSSGWREFCFGAVVQMLEEMESSYTPFLRVDVVLDVNDGNAFQERLLHWPRSRMPPASRVTVRVDSHAKAKMDHPFRLAWMHRAHMASKVDSYDWFLSAEADTFVPARAMLAQVALAEKLYERHNAILGFVRLCNDTSGRSFYSDITKPVPRSSVVEYPGLGSFVPPQNTYAAVWAYPRKIFRAFIGTADWTTPQKYVKAMREKAAWGCRYGCGKILTLADDPSLRIYHLGKSGPYLVRVRGHNTLPAERMVV